MKKKAIIVLLLIVTMVSCLLSACTVQTIETNKDYCVGEQIRTIETKQSSLVTETQKFIDKFDTYQSSSTDNTIEFEGTMFASVGELIGLDVLDAENQQLTKRYKTKYDFSKNLFYLTVTYYNENEIIVESIEYCVDPTYDEDKDDVFVEFENEKIYFSESFVADAINECIAGVDDAIYLVGGVVIVGGLLITIAASQPEVIQETITTVKYITEKIEQKVASVWSWIKRFVTTYITVKKTVVTKSYKEVKVPTIELNKEKIITKAIATTALAQMKQGEYFLAFYDPSNGQFYLSTAPISFESAVAIMSAATPIPCMVNRP